MNKSWLTVKKASGQQMLAIFLPQQILPRIWQNRIFSQTCHPNPDILQHIPACSPCPPVLPSPQKARSPDSTWRSGAAVASAQTRGSGWQTCNPQRPWCAGPPGCPWAGWWGWWWCPRIPWGEPRGSRPRFRVNILKGRWTGGTSKIPSAKMRTALMIVSFEVESVTSTWGWRIALSYNVELGQEISIHTYQVI